MMTRGGGSSRHPFTPSQWQELELHALVFKYMASAVPVPPDLVRCVRRNLFPHPPASRSSCLFGLGNCLALNTCCMLLLLLSWVGREEGRSRAREVQENGREEVEVLQGGVSGLQVLREAHPQGERPFKKACGIVFGHRPAGRLPQLAKFPPSSSSSSSSLSLSSPRTDHHLLFPCSSSVRPSAMGSGYSRCEDSSNFCLQALPHSLDKHRNILGFEEGAHEFPVLPEGCRTGRELRCSFGHMEMSSKHTYSRMQSIDSHFRICASKGEEDEQHCLLGAGLKMEMAVNGRLEKEEQPRPFHCFLDEEPPKVDGSWMSMDVGLKTQLSMSIPLANHDVPVTASQGYNEG